MIKPYRGHFHTEWFPKTASTAYTYNDMVTIASTVAAGAGTLKLAASTDTRLIGLIQQEVASTDSDYASATMVPVLVGDADAEFLFPVGTGTAATTDIGEYIDLVGEDSVNVDAYTIGQILVTKIISTAKVVGKINKGFGKEIPATT